MSEVCCCYKMEIPWSCVERLGDLLKIGYLFVMELCDPMWFITANLFILELIHMP